MKILYVTGLWSGLRDVLYEGRSHGRGMPGFLEPLRRLLDAGHEVDLVVAGPDAHAPLDVGADWLRACRVFPVTWEPRGWRRYVSPVLLYRRVLRALDADRYDLVYGHGRLSAVACLAARRRGVPCGVRIYGTLLIRPLSQLPVWRVRLRQPMEVLSFVVDKDFMIVTNDGTRGDRVYRQLVRAPIREFHFLFNGVDPAPDGGATTSGPPPPAGRFLLYPGRISRWKRQDLGVEVLRELHALGYTDVTLAFAGHVSEPDYQAELEGLVAAYGLESSVLHLGPVERSALPEHYRAAAAVLAFYEVSQLGNVMIEALSSGAAVVAADDGSLEGVVRDGENGFLAADPAAAARSIAALLDDPARDAGVRERARARAAETFVSWDARARAEREILERVAAAVARRGSTR